MSGNGLRCNCTFSGVACAVNDCRRPRASSARCRETLSPVVFEDFITFRRWCQSGGGRDTRPVSGTRPVRRSRSDREDETFEHRVIKVSGRGRAVAGNNDAVVNGFSRTGRRLAGSEAGRRRSLKILLVWHRSGGRRDTRPVSGTRRGT